MKKIYFFALLLIFWGAMPVLQAQELPAPEKNFFQMRSEFLKSFGKSKAKLYEKELRKGKLSENEAESPDAELFLRFKRWEHYWQPKVDPLTGAFPSPWILFEEARKQQAREAQLRQKYPERTLANVWKYIGAPTVPTNSGAGRANCITAFANNPNLLWAGAAGGGAWKTTNAGNGWQTTTDKLPSVSVSDIAFDAKTSAVFIATGDAWGSENFSSGIFKSTDGGNTWNPTGLTFQTSSTRVLSRLLIHPSNNQILLAASNSGIHKSTDGGNTWSIKQNGNFRDMEFRPGNPQIMYAVTSRTFFKSTDGGDTWRQISSTGFSANAGRTTIAVTNANQNYVYALTTVGNAFGSVHLSTDAGETWQIRSSSPNILGYNVTGNDNGGQGNYDLALAISPTNPNLVFVGGINIWRSTDGGRTWKISAHWYGDNGTPYVHADIHDLDFDPANGNVVYAATDGGIFKSTDQGTGWTDISSDMHIKQFYKVASSQTDPDLIIGGSQDNGTNLGKNGEWSQVLGGDGMNCLINPQNARYVYGSLYYGDIYVSTQGGAENSFGNAVNSNITREQGNWVTPFIFNPANPRIMYAGFANVWRSENFGQNGSWRRISSFTNSAGSMNYLAIAPSDTAIIVAGNGAAGRISTDAGKNWSILQYPVAASSVTSFSFDPTNSNRAWITVSGFTPNNQCFQTDDRGATWTNISAGLPAVTNYCIVYQKNTAGRIYIGTDIGVYYRDTLMTQWVPYNEGLPLVEIRSMEIMESIGTLRVGTYGRGIWEAPLADCESFTGKLVVNGNLTFCEGDSIVISAPEGFSEYNWSNGAKTRSILVRQSGVYSASLTNAKGCIGLTDAVTVTVNPRRIPAITPSRASYALCGDKDSIVLDAGSLFRSYKWSTGDTARTITVRTPGKYTVTAVNNSGCASTSQEVEVKVAVLPDIPEIVRSGDTLRITGTFARIQWQRDGANVSGGTRNFIVLPANSVGRKYTVRVENQAGCAVFSNAYTVGVLGISQAEPGFFELTLSPNPANEKLILRLSSKRASSSAQLVIVIRDIQGRLIQQQSVANDAAEIQHVLMLEGLSSGNYLLEILDGNTIIASSSFIRQ
jgi:hypothetical protein